MISGIKKRPQILRDILSFIVVVFILALISQGPVYGGKGGGGGAAFTDAADGDWNSATTWTCTTSCAGEYPTSSDAVTISSHTIALTGDESASSITMNGGTLNLGTGNTLSVGNITLNNGTLNMNTSNINCTGQFVIEGGTVNGGSGTTTSNPLIIRGGTFVAPATVYSYDPGGMAESYVHLGGVTDWLTNQSTLHIFSSVDYN